MEVGSLDRAAKPLISDAVVDSNPRVTAWPGSPSRDARLLTVLESSRLKSDDNTVAMDHLVTFLFDAGAEPATGCHSRAFPEMNNRSFFGLCLFVIFDASRSGLKQNFLATTIQVKQLTYNID